MSGKWEIVEVENGVHVIPVDDLREHLRSIYCWCQPCNDEGVKVHNSKDGREFHEPDRKVTQ